MRCTGMHGAGNSFYIINNIDGALSEEECRRLAVKLCSPVFGKRTDGLIAVTRADDADFGMLFINSDGSFGEMCGNGARCLARYGVETGLSSNAENIRIKAAAGIVTGRRIDRETYEVRLNDPAVIIPRTEACGEVCSYIELGNPGIPHAVIMTEPSALDDMDTLRITGRKVRNFEGFKKGANVTFAALTGPASVKAATFERGVEDFTLACGTGCGAVAAAFAANNIISESSLEIEMPGGRLSVRFKKEGMNIRDIYLTGPTAVTCEFDTEI